MSLRHRNWQSPNAHRGIQCEGLKLVDEMQRRRVVTGGREAGVDRVAGRQQAPDRFQFPWRDDWLVQSTKAKTENLSAVVFPEVRRTIWRGVNGWRRKGGSLWQPSVATVWPKSTPSYSWRLLPFKQQMDPYPIHTPPSLQHSWDKLSSHRKKRLRLKFSSCSFLKHQAGKDSTARRELCHAGDVLMWLSRQATRESRLCCPSSKSDGLSATLNSFLKTAASWAFQCTIVPHAVLLLLKGGD